MKNTIVILVITVIGAGCNSGNPVNKETGALVIDKGKLPEKMVISFKVNKQVCTAKNLEGEVIEITDGEIINGKLNPGVRSY